MSRRRLLVPALLLVCTAAIYLPGLADAPLFVSHDEIVYSLQAHALASTGRDLSGRVLPMYIEYPATFGRPTYDQPLLIYAIAIALKILPFSEAAIRLPMVVAGIVDVLLVYWIALVLFESELFAIAAATLLALTPAHFMHARTAIDFQLSVPFILGWLLCVVAYLRRQRPRLLLGAGLILGASLFGYVAAIVLVPILIVCTAATLFARGEPLNRYGWLAGGLLLPCLLALPWMLRYPLPFRDVIAHYTVLHGPESSRSGIVELVRGFAGSSRLRELPALYASFWDPEFLFIDGPLRFRATQLVGVFLVALSGAIVVGIVQAVRRRSADDFLLLAGLLTGPLVASLGGEGQTIWRTLQIAPFGVLLAVGGLRDMWIAESTPATRISLVVIFALPIALATWHHDAFPNAQGLVRAATVPLAAAGFAMLLGSSPLGRVGLVRGTIFGAAVIAMAHAVFLVTHEATAIGIVVIAVLAAATLTGRAMFAERPLMSIGMIALATATFMYAYVDYGAIRRIGPFPASALVLALRLVFSFAALSATLAALRGGTRPSTGSGRAVRPGIVPMLLLAIQIAYFAIDYFTDYRLRAAQAALVLAALIGLAAAIAADSPPRIRFGPIAMAGVAGLAAIQFTTFYVDYFTQFSARGSADVEGNVRGAFETVIQRSRERATPAIYLGRIGPYAYGELFWKFYLIKHHREDLEAKTIADGDFKPDRVRALPPGSIAITSPTRDIDRLIDGMAAAGEIRRRELLRAPDGAPIFWVLEIGP